MSYCLHIFGTVDECPTRNELAEFILEGEYLSDEAVFQPRPVEAESRLADWDRLSVRDGNRAVVIERHVGDHRLREEVEKLLFVLPKTRPSPDREWVTDVLRQARQLVTLCVDKTTDDDWEMLDSLEALLLKKCGGVLFAPREGFYDGELQLRHRV
jgi:hypothetical protein